MARLALVFALGLTLLLPSPTAWADDPPPRADRERVVRLGVIVIPGWIHNPGVVFVLERSRPRYTPTPLQRPDFLRATRGL